jgi:predicted SAM-dependent methyltransferase
MPLSSNSIKNIDRHRCVFTGCSDLEMLFALKDFPVYMGCVDSLREDDMKADLSFWISRGSGSVQLNPIMDPSIVYKFSHGSGTVGKSWIEHHVQFSDFISKHEPRNILEIGGGHGVLADLYIKNNPISSWITVEPNPVVRNDKVTYVNTLFDEDFSIDAPIDAIVHSHTFEHFYDIIRITNKFWELLPENGRMIFSVPSLQLHLERLYTNVMNFEHTVYLSEGLIDRALRNQGFIIEEKQFHKDDHSIFYSAKKVLKRTKQDYLLNNFYHLNKSSFTRWYDFHRKLVSSFNEKIRSFDGDVYLFGGHAMSQFLLAFGLDEERVGGVIDNDVTKRNKRLYGTSLVCRLPADYLVGKKNQSAVILRAGVFNQEIKEGILENVSSKVVFWEGDSSN